MNHEHAHSPQPPQRPDATAPRQSRPVCGLKAMSGSSAVVAINALMLKRTKLAGIKRVGSPGAPATGANVCWSIGMRDLTRAADLNSPSERRAATVHRGLGLQERVG